MDNYRVLLPEGTILDSGKYRIDQPLASGGFGNTYIATDVRMNVRCVVKEFFMSGINSRIGNDVTVSVPTNLMTFESQKRKFMKEAQRLFRLNSPHIVRVHSLFEENSTAYYVMDYIEGKSLSAIMKERGQAFSEAEVRNILTQIFDALRTIHTDNPPLYHLDIKPGNILMDDNGHVTLIDFGASKQLSSEGNAATTSTAMSYTPGYAPVEQIEQDINNIGAWTDFYALGATLYNLLSANKPPSISSLRRSDAFQYPPGTTGNIKSLIKWMMSLNHDERPRTVDACITALNNPSVITPWHDNDDEKTIIDEIKKDDNIIVEPPQVPSQQHSSSNKALLAIVAVLSIIAIIVVVLLVTNDSKSATQEVPCIEEAIDTTTEPPADATGHTTEQAPVDDLDDETRTQIGNIMVRWDNLHNRDDEIELRFLYAENAKLYGQVMSRQQIEERKRRAIYDANGYKQESINIRMMRVDDNNIRCYFTKRTWSGKNGSQEYPSYLDFKYIDGEWLIVEESDDITDRNLN